jgi:hypothetical protein
VVEITWQATGQASFVPGVANSRNEQSQCIVSVSSLFWQSRSDLSDGVKYCHSRFPTALLSSLYQCCYLSRLVCTYRYVPCFLIRYVESPNLLQASQWEVCGIAVGSKVREVFDRLLNKFGVEDLVGLISRPALLTCVEGKSGLVKMQVLVPGFLTYTNRSMKTEQLIVVSSPLSDSGLPS